MANPYKAQPMMVSEPDSWAASCRRNKSPDFVAHQLRSDNIVSAGDGMVWVGFYCADCGRKWRTEETAARERELFALLFGADPNIIAVLAAEDRIRSGLPLRDQDRAALAVRPKAPDRTAAKQEDR